MKNVVLVLIGAQKGFFKKKKLDDHESCTQEENTFGYFVYVQLFNKRIYTGHMITQVLNSQVEIWVINKTFIQSL